MQDLISKYSEKRGIYEVKCIEGDDTKVTLTMKKKESQFIRQFL